MPKSWGDMMMLKIIRGSVASYALVAGAAAALSALATWQGAVLVTPSAAQPAAGGVPSAVHSTSRNPSTEQRLKLLVFMVADQKNPSTVPE
jgi:hypothetical protein